MKKNKAIVFFLFLMLYAFSYAQHNDLSYSQYWINGLAINPAYSGSREVFNISMLYQKKWAGIEGSPANMTFSAHAPLKNEKLALGLFIMNQSYGVSKNTQMYLNYAYRMELGKGKLSFGLKAGVSMINEDLGSLLSGLVDQTDPAFTQVEEKRVQPGVGFGVYYYNSRFFVGASVPDMLSYGLNIIDSVSTKYEGSLSPSNYTYMFTGGILIGKSASFKWKPSFLIAYRTDYDAMRYDINSSFIFLDNKIWVGASYRSGGSYPSPVIVGNIELHINRQFMLGYAYDYSLGGLNSAMNGVHEIILRYEFGYKIEALNPRFF